MSNKLMLQQRWGFLLMLNLLVACGTQAPPNPQPSAPPPPQVTVAQPIQESIVEWDEYTGHLEAKETVEIRARVNGTIDSVNFKAGGYVKKGDLLFVIDPRPYQAEVDRAQAELLRTQSRYELAKTDLQRAERMFRSKAVSEEELDARRNALREAEAGILAAQAALKSAKLNIEFAQIRAPINGIISREYLTKGNLISNSNAATLLATIVTIDPVYVYLDIDERSILKYQKLDQARQSSLSIPAELALADEDNFPRSGNINYLEPRLDATTGTIRARGVFSNSDGRLKPGFFARVRIPGSERYDALLVKELAISSDQGRKSVVVINAKQHAEIHPVTLGAKINDLRVVKSGLNASDWVVINGLSKIQPGMQVSPQKVRMADNIQTTTDWPAQLEKK